MSNRLNRQLDLLQDCNDQHVSPKEFMGIFCKRCRNSNCVNAGWSESSWSDRMATQVSRLITNPNFADPNDPQFEAVRDLNFRELAEPLINTGRDPWEVPEVHLVDPERQTSHSADVEQAIRTLAESRGKSPPQPLESSQVQEPKPAPVKAPQAAQPHQGPSRPNPRHYTVDTPPMTTPQSLPQREVNTPFPADGMMIDGSLAPQPQIVDTSTVDPWAPPPDTSPQPRKVPVGARIRMGEEPKK